MGETRKFRGWLYESIFDEGNGADMSYLFAETPEDYAKLGYRKLTSKYDNPRLGIKVGDPVWWHPQTKDVKPFNQISQQPAQPQRPIQQPNQPQRPNQPRMAGDSDETFTKLGYRKIRAKFDNPRIGAQAGDEVWWNSQTKDVQPIGGKAPLQQPPVNDKMQQADEKLRAQNQLRPNEAPGDPFICGVAVEGNEFGIPAGQRLVARKDANGTWEVWDQHLRGRELMPTDDIKKTIVANRDANGQGEKTNYPMNYLRPKKEKKKTKTIDDNQISEEQAQIDAQFSHMIADKRQNHMMISALAGTGKTTILKHLAWKYGQPGQKWLYLVFNTKNKEEATPDFPDFVNVQTTNGFLGKMLGSPENMERFPQTNLIASLEKKGKGEGGRKLEKSRIIADTPQFASMMDDLGIPDPNKINMPMSSNSTLGILRFLRNHFQRQVLKLLGLAKSYALDPRVPQDAMAGLELLVEDYETQVDVRMTDVKDALMRMAKKSPYNYQRVIADLSKVFQGNFFAKSFKQEVMKATYWMMEQSMPHTSQHQYQHDDGNNYNLADFRDFDDDFWYSAIHSNEIHWPHYDVVLADEVQDFNEDQRIMLNQLAKAGAKIVAVGDENQAMYRFRGADSAAFHGLHNDLSNGSANPDIKRTLSKNFRSRPAILQHSNENTHVKDLKAGREFDDGYEGTVTDGDEEYDDAFKKLKWEQNKFGFRKETAFISRTNEPLVHAALKLLTEGLPFVIVGKDISKSLRDHIRKIKKDERLRDDFSVSDLAQALQDHYDSEEGVFQGERTKDAYLKDLKETTDALIAAIGQFSSEHANASNDQGNYRPGSYDPYADNDQSGTIKEFEDWIYQRLGGLNVDEDARDAAMFRKKMEEQNPVVLTTSHKSKGLEFERVYLLRADQFPHPRSRNSPKDMKQEANAKYVAYTRPKNDFSILKLDNQPGYVPPKPDRDAA